METGAIARVVRYVGILIVTVVLIFWSLSRLDLNSTVFFTNLFQHMTPYFVGFFIAGMIFAIYGNFILGSIRREAIGQVFVIDHRDSDNAGIAYYKGIELRIASTGLLDSGDQVRITGTQSESLTGFGVLFIGVKV